MNRSRWLVAAITGIATVTMTLLVVALVIIDKKHFGTLVGSYFLQTIVSAIFLGALLLLVAAWKLREHRNWYGRVLILWALIALTSPAFGLMFLIPFAVLALSLPAVIAIVAKLWRTRNEPAPLTTP